MKLSGTLCIFILLLIGDSCIDRLFFDVEGLDQSVLIVDGQITDEPGPYTVKLFRALSADDAGNTLPVAARAVTIFDDAGISEVLKTGGDGIYQSDPNGIRGVVGKKYHIRIELSDGDIFESTPEEITPAGKIDSLYYEFESFQPINAPTQNGFRIFIDAHNTRNTNSYLRWKFYGAYQVESFPELNRYGSNCAIIKGEPNPLPCSGYIYAGTIRKQSDCTCCICWVSNYEKKPKLNDSQTVSNGQYKNVEMGYVPFDQWTFGRGKFMVKVEQMSLSKDAYDFWKIFKDQKDGLTNLFQPAFGTAKTNIFSTKSEKKAIGIFSAASIDIRILFLTGADSPLSVPPYDIEPPEENCALWQSCTQVYSNASVLPPKEWE